MNDYDSFTTTNYIVFQLSNYNYNFFLQKRNQLQLIMSQGCHNRASRPDSEHIITEQCLSCGNYMVTMPYVPCIVSGV